jgi:anti-sigma B factor antagonist
MGEALTVGVRRERGCEIVTAVGEVDIASVTWLRPRLFDLAATGRPLVVDLDQVSFIDSAGIGALVGTAKRAAAYDGSLSVVCTRPQIRRLFRLVGLDRKIPLAHTLDAALKDLAAARTTADLSRTG